MARDMDTRDDAPRYAPIRCTGNPLAQLWFRLMDRRLRAQGMMHPHARDLLDAQLRTERKEDGGTIDERGP